MAVVLPQSIQSDVQSALPVIPNNGNPGGAYNMPHSPAEQQQQVAAPDPFAWLKPSSYMEEVKNRLANWDQEVQEGIERIMLPQENGYYNPAVGPYGTGFVPVTDDGLPIMTNQHRQATGIPFAEEDPNIPLIIYDDPYSDYQPDVVIPEM